MTGRIRERLAPGAGRDGLPTAQSLHTTADYYRSGFDATHGGLGGQQKFPSSLSVRMLLRHHRRTGDGESLTMATRTLEAMAAGGIRDQVGGGFHRYSTDPQWLVPHFEQMLYDNALLVPAYLEAYQVTGREDFADVARDILRYVERDMTAPDGAFYSATDADSLGPDGER
ncbi:MAG TPA: thioredoxin domain-containing protein, partial [Acidobacteria bacterium]|nr:thioredoxin domain-containing protein [Acidobacteriota bacterium]